MAQPVREAAASGGLEADCVRRMCWPLLLGHPESGNKRSLELPAAGSWRSGAENDRMREQIWKDVERSLAGDHQHLRPALHQLICACLEECPYLHYYQGFHDIAALMLLLLGRDRSLYALSALSRFWLRDYMLCNLDATVYYLELSGNLFRYGI